MFGIDDAALAIGGSAVISGVLGSNASRSAAGQAAGAADRATQAQTDMYTRTRADLAPYREAGTPALQRLMYLSGVGGAVDTNDPRYKAILDPMIAEIDRQHIDAHGFSAFDPRANAGGTQTWVSQATQKARDQYTAQYGDEAKNDPAYGSLTKPFEYSLSDFYKDPSYQFRRGEGEKAIERSMAARGLSSSTPGLQALMKYNQDYASTEYGADFGRALGVDTYNRQNKFNMLSYLGTGQNAATMTGQAGVNTAAGMAGSIIAGGQAQAAGTVGSAGAINNSIQGGLGNYMYQQRFDQMMQRMPVFAAANSPAGAPNYASGAAGGYG
jgi:hypothetical protein